jgi:hypothetical protein
MLTSLQYFLNFQFQTWGINLKPEPNPKPEAQATLTPNSNFMQLQPNSTTPYVTNVDSTTILWIETSARRTPIDEWRYGADWQTPAWKTLKNILSEMKGHLLKINTIAQIINSRNEVARKGKNLVNNHNKHLI